MRLIDADEFEKWAWSNPDIVVDGDVYVSPYAVSNFALDHTIEAEPVRHGRWIVEENGVVVCSECGEEHEWDDYRASFCEDCGAKMDGGAADDAES